jgi:hypothetical protein
MIHQTNRIGKGQYVCHDCATYLEHGRRFYFQSNVLFLFKYTHREIKLFLESRNRALLSR